MRDLEDALRALRFRPTISALAILSLAIGIGGVIAIFSLTDRLLLRALPVREPERLALVSAAFTLAASATLASWISVRRVSCLDITSVLREG